MRASFSPHSHQHQPFALVLFYAEPSEQTALPGSLCRQADNFAPYSTPFKGVWPDVEISGTVPAFSLNPRGMLPLPQALVPELAFSFWASQDFALGYQGVLFVFYFYFLF